MFLNVCFDRYILTAEKISESGKSIEMDEIFLYKRKSNKRGVKKQIGIVGGIHRKGGNFVIEVLKRDKKKLKNL